MKQVERRMYVIVFLSMGLFVSSLLSVVIAETITADGISTKLNPTTEDGADDVTTPSNEDDVTTSSVADDVKISSGTDDVTTSSVADDITTDITEDISQTAVYEDNVTTLMNYINTTDLVNTTDAYYEYEMYYWEYPAYITLHDINTVFHFTVNIPTILANMLIMYVIVRLKPFTANSLFILTLAISDMNFAFAQIMGIWGTVLYQKIRTFYWCKIFVTYYNFWHPFSNYITVLWTVERFIAVRYPLKMSSWCTLKNTQIMIAITTVVLFGINLMYLDLSYPIVYFDGLPNCMYKDFIFDVWAYFEVIVHIWIPLVIITTLNGMIVLKMRKLRKEFSAMNTNSETSEKRFIENRKVTRVLIAVATMFIVTQTPKSVLYILEIFIKYDPIKNLGITHKQTVVFAIIIWIFETIAYLNNCSNFLLYVVSGKTFRRALMQMVCKCRAGKPKKMITGQLSKITGSTHVQSSYATSGVDKSV